MKFILVGFLILSSTAAMAGFSMIQLGGGIGPGTNFLTGSSGSDFLLDGSSGKLTAN